MIQVGVLLVVAGVASSVWRERNKTSLNKQLQGLSVPSAKSVHEAAILPISHHTFETTDAEEYDDVGELKHYQTVAWYTLSLAAAGALFYPPARLLSLPLLGYNSYNFWRVLQHSSKKDKKSAITLFETIGVAGSLLTGKMLMVAAVLSFSFGYRKLWLNTGNIANTLDFSAPLDPKHTQVWLLLEGVEVEATVADVEEGDVIVLHAGDTVVLEGQVISGEGVISQFGLCRQMKTISKQAGDKVYPFTELVAGELYVRII